MLDDRPDLVVSSDDYLYFVERAVKGMEEIITDLGDRLACARPDLPGANTPYGLLTHCLGVMAYWGGHLVAGRAISRDRLAEFDAAGTVGELRAQVNEALQQLRSDLGEVDPAAPLRHEPAPWALGPDRPVTQAPALIHLYEEVAQHHGQMQILRDALRASEPPTSERSHFDDVTFGWLRNKRAVKWHRPGPDVIPAWVADMDYPVAPAIRTALEGALDRGDLGYPDWPVHPLAGPFTHRMHDRYNWSPNPGHVRGVTDLIQALQIVISLGSRPGDGIVAHTPNYPPFLATVTTMDRTLIPAPLHPHGPSSWSWDQDRLDADLVRTGAKVLLLVNPHNPTGRVFTQSELETLADLAERHDLIVVSDEIHAELTHRPLRHIPFASLGARTAARTVTVTSASKAFNIAGLRTAVAHVGPAALREAWDAQPPDLFGATNVLGVEATLAAWAHGSDWLTGLSAHLLTQRDRLATHLQESPGVTMRPPEAGYLAWLDCSGADLADPAMWFRQHAGIELSPGPDFGPGNHQYVRLNFATTTELLDDIAVRLRDSLPRRD